MEIGEKIDQNILDFTSRIVYIHIIILSWPYAPFISSYLFVKSPGDQPSLSRPLAPCGISFFGRRPARAFEEQVEHQVEHVEHVEHVQDQVPSNWRWR